MAKKWRKSNHIYPNNQEMTIKNQRQQFPFHLFYEKFLGLWKTICILKPVGGINSAYTVGKAGYKPV